MIRACLDCRVDFAPTYPDQWECDECDARRTDEAFARLEEIEHGKAVMEDAGDRATDEFNAFLRWLRCSLSDRR
jgi:hypothetical protein